SMPASQRSKNRQRLARSNPPRPPKIPMSSARLASLLVLFAATASAQSSTSAMAENLFREGRKLLDQKNYDEACPKPAESARLEPSSGTLLALGICHEGQGKTASAWADYSAAATIAKRDKRPDREKAANNKVAALEPKLARVTISVAPETSKLSGLEV